MVKKTLTLILLLFAVVKIYGQDSWIELKYPQSGIIGKLVTKINNGDLEYEPISTNKGFTTESYQSAESINDYREKVGSFFSKLLETKKLKVKNVSIRKMVIKSLAMDAVKSLKPGSLYVYEAISADTITVRITKSKNIDVKIDEIAKLVADNLTSGAAEAASKILPIVEDMAYTHRDSIQYEMTIANPSVYYKVRVVNYLNITKVDWNNYWLYFSKGKNVKKQNSTKLVIDPLGIKSSTDPFYPEFWEVNNTDIQFKIELREEDSKLKLYILGKGFDYEGNWRIVKEVPTVANGMWRLDREFIYSFPYKGVTKKVYIQCIARAIDKNTVEIINWVDNKRKLINAKTFMQYPEIKFEYKTKD